MLAYLYSVVVFAGVLHIGPGQTDIFAVAARVPRSAFVTPAWALAYLALFNHPLMPTDEEVKNGVVKLSTRARWPPRPDLNTNPCDGPYEGFDIPASLLQSEIPSGLLSPAECELALSAARWHDPYMGIPANTPVITIWCDCSFIPAGVSPSIIVSPRVLLTRG
jgi:hypothetical protein